MWLAHPARTHRHIQACGKNRKQDLYLTSGKIYLGCTPKGEGSKKNNWRRPSDMPAKPHLDISSSSSLSSSSSSSESMAFASLTPAFVFSRSSLGLFLLVLCLRCTALTQDNGFAKWSWSQNNIASTGPRGRSAPCAPVGIKRKTRAPRIAPNKLPARMPSPIWILTVSAAVNPFVQRLTESVLMARMWPEAAAVLVAKRPAAQAAHSTPNMGAYATIVKQ
mmetsp:Transcript_24110/g.61013  ORF Transcript_24110/g.61013 Transcript_24110/m.61013 type:complete len:221 (+) Transcript_24110:142-804(+)